MATTEALRKQISQAMPEIIDELTELVAIPSVAFAGHDLAQVRRSAEHVASLFEQLGGQVEILSAPTDSGEKGQDAVVAHFEGPAGAPRVLLYAHHDVQPAAGQGGWDQADPFKAERRGDRLYGRGTADDGAGVITHVESLRALKALGELPVNVTVYIEGEEEVGSPSFVNFLNTYRERLEADVIVVADSSNWKVGTPALTTSLRGVVQSDVTVTTLDHGLHSGQFGGPVPDATTTLIRLLASLHDEAGDVAVKGLVSQSQADPDFPFYPEEDFRADAGLLEGVQLMGTGDLTARVWTKPSITVIGIDTPSIAQSSNTLTPSASARISMRIAPGQDPREAHAALEAHLLEHAPFGAQVKVFNRELGQPFKADGDSEATVDAMESLAASWQSDAVKIGQGGSIPFISDLREVFPQAQVLVTGIEDPDSRAHSANESMHLGELENIVLAQALLLARLGGALED